MMNSDHLDEAEPLRENRLHHRGETAINIRDDNANGKGHGNGSNNNGGPATTPSTTQLHMKRRPKKTNFWDRTIGHSRINVNDNYAKYGKKRVKRNTHLESFIFWGALGTAMFFLGFAWKHFTREPSPSQLVRPQLRRPSDHSTSDTITTGQTKEQPKTKKQSAISLLIPRFDTRKYVNSWQQNMRDAAGEVGKKHPKSFAIEGWNFPIAFRSFPYAKQTHGPMKNVDSDYGGITYHSLRNEDVFERVIPEDTEYDVVPGGFDPDSIATRDDLKRRNRKRRHQAGSYPNYDSGGRKILEEDAGVNELKHYYDDDSVKVFPKANDGKTREPRACKKTEFSQLYFPTCNDFHEHDLGRVYDDPEKIVSPRPENEIYRKYIAHGYYRDVWVVEDGPWIWPEHYAKEKIEEEKKYGVENEENTARMVRTGYRSAALKTFQMKHPFEDEHFEEVQLEAIIMERTTKSPRIMDIYGHCSFSTMVEIVPIEFEETVVIGEGYEDHDAIEKRNKDGVRPFNNYTATEKLNLALEMAESLADLHGFEDGVIVHDDVQLCQWLHTPDGRLKLGDFNRATIMQWDLLKGEYCRFNNGPAFANYRAPEEYVPANLNEQIDTWSFGNNIYALITGLWNFYETDDDGVVQKKLIDGKVAYVDPRYRERSFAEKKLIELMEKCWIYDPDERISMFEAVDFLRKAIKENETRGNKQ